MLTIILKIIMCSSFFIAVYYLFLEREKIYTFNRFFLLASLILSYVIPFITFTIPSNETAHGPQLIFEETTQQIASIGAKQSEFNWMSLFGLMYADVSIYLLIKSISAFLAIRRIKGKKIVYQNHHIMLTEANLPPFSFWNTIYIGKNYVKNNMIDPRIFLHEKTHIIQKHSIDIILIDIIMVLTWINPVLFLYKKTLITNHEFLADEAVLNNKFNMKEYQNLIFDEIISRQNLHLTHSFNFINTKKRFIMMNNQKTRFSLLRKTAGITAILASVALFSEKAFASESKNMKSEFLTQQKNPVPLKIPDIQKETLSENPEHNKIFIKNPTARLSEIKEEKLKTIQDTIIPKAKTDSNEGNNTNSTADPVAGQNRTLPEYPGGSKTLREKIGKNMDIASLTSQKGVIKSAAYIHIDAAGNATDIKVSGDNDTFNRELLKTVTAISNETTWKPATENGKAVAAVLKIPVTMSFAQ
ncbi:hypothetical protein DRF59_04970 [Chryseobacterium flavum]|uniref:Peptidase M56 domain-containing protein n=1 Tax=Chryseobacterium flavum TaxID=415851 RepID=A0A3D9CRH7_9FLAO|nr:M56 family metallopeptidase [Chryseobacterium flavum]REC68395.1 hypothetical protein DRF59_04970 [Chryseobacterium flavum]